MTYEKLDWENLPAQRTPLSAARLNHMQTQYDEAVAYADSNKVEKSAASSKVYGTSAAGTQTVYGVSATTSPSTVVQRNAAGQVQAANPTDATHLATKSYTDAADSSLADAFSADLAALGKAYLQMQDLTFSTRIGTSPNGGVELAGPFEFAIYTPSQEIEVTGCYLVFDFDQAIPASTTKAINWRLLHRKQTSDTALDIVQKSTSADGMTVRRKVWDMTNGSWGTAANRKVPKGSVISLLPTDFTGGAKVLLPMLVVVHYRPVR